MKRAKPELKIILVGDFNQLPPVKDRLLDSNSEAIRARWELCDGNELTLTTRRRSDDTLFNMLKSENINHIIKATFGNDTPLGLQSTVIPVEAWTRLKSPKELFEAVGQNFDGVDLEDELDVDEPPDIFTEFIEQPSEPQQIINPIISISQRYI